MNSQFIFKIAVYKNKEASGDGEIRKFQVSQTNSTNYSQLLAKLRSYYKFAGVQIFWTDSEFDEIKIDSDEDLAMAQNESGTGTLKLKVILEGFENSSENVGDDDEAMELESDGHDTDAGGKAEEKSVDGNYVLSLMVYVVQCLGLQPCQSDQPGELSVTSYMIRVAAGLSTRLTKSALLMSSLCLLTLLSMFLPSFIINSVIYFILAFSLGLPIATLVLGNNVMSAERIFLTSCCS